MRVQTTHIQAMLRQALALAEGIDGADHPDGARDSLPVEIEVPTCEGPTTMITNLSEVVDRVAELTDHANAEMRNELSKARGWKEP